MSTGFGQTEAQKLLIESSRYHDPNGLWEKSKVEIKLNEVRPGYPDRKTELMINNKTGRFVMHQIREGHEISFDIKGDKCKIKFDGSTPHDTVAIKKFNLTPNRARVIRDYYTYLYGLPMRLLRDGSIPDEQVTTSRFNGSSALTVRVTYPPNLGSDIWYFYFNPQSKQLVGYRFYHDEEKNDGEYIILENEVSIGRLILPQDRSWYTNNGDELLGSDRIILED